ncbi:MAG: hypothetical protein AVDCRST_MAG28-2880 [uncultured Rubrobacteraceae bacterium]|uniref:DUF1772-domain-containing protein n=1 Tax=uncultured Rubrobacteraceae bacterium TaxID=349277 RepID=A0A6J4R8C0_9ACTN|nr:MAG: hypothetical protein AVDCRST_MAG28-2880 [uncultured Rubrobacteraceae bacterium]
MFGQAVSTRGTPESKGTATALAELIATLSSGLFTGASVYINLVEHPARMQTGIRPALTEFAPSYHRATVTQVSLAIAGFLGALVAWRSRSDARWLIGGGLLVSVIPFTALAILPTNKKLLDPETAKDLALAEKLLNRWGKLHAVRSVLSLASLLMFLFLLTKDRD